jgi:autotransporter passenger strand-loop-strand repeat protein
VQSGGVASATTVASGGTLTVSAGGVGSGGTIASGGFDILLSGGRENAIVVVSGGVLELAGPIHSGAHIVPPGMVTSAEVISGVTLLSGAILQALPQSRVAVLAQSIAAHAPAVGAGHASPSPGEARSSLIESQIGFATSARG